MRAFAGFAPDRSGQAVGLVNAFLDVSTFRARLRLNIHDIYVHPHFQRRGIGAAWLEVVAHAAFSEGCCRITLEVLEGNLGALAAYRRAGLGGYRRDPTLGQAIYREKLPGEA